MVAGASVNLRRVRCHLRRLLLHCWQRQSAGGDHSSIRPGSGRVSPPGTSHPLWLLRMDIYRQPANHKLPLPPPPLSSPLISLILFHTFPLFSQLFSSLEFSLSYFSTLCITDDAAWRSIHASAKGKEKG